MCFIKQKDVKQRDPLPSPEKVADPTDIGSSRQREDEELFGGVPDMRVDRTAVGEGVAEGTGLRELM